MAEARPRARKAAARQGGDDDEASIFELIAARSAVGANEARRFTNVTALNERIGMPCPSLALSHLLQCNVIPFGRVGIFVGEEGSGKSSLMAALLYELAKLGDVTARTIYDRVHYIDNEAYKPSGSLLPPFFDQRLRGDLEGVVLYSSTTQMEKWQSAFLAQLKDWRERWDPAAGGPGWRVPLGVGIDGIMSTGCQETINKVGKDGFAGKGFPAESNALAKFARAIAGDLARRPILWLATNQLKPFTDPDTGLPVRNIAGGKSLKFAESFEIQVNRVKDIRTNDRSGYVARLRAYKNCVGEGRRSVEVSVIWQNDDDPLEPGARIPYAMWDWPAASINLLKAIKAKDKARWDRICEVVDIHDGRNANLGWSNALGVPSSSQVPLHELGCLLEERPDILDALYPILDIDRGRFFRLGKDYEAMLLEQDATPSPQAERVWRRPACGGIGKALSSGELDVSGAISAVRGFNTGAEHDAA